MELYSWNINGYRTCDRFGGFSKILQKSPDFICCQEVKISRPETMTNLFTQEYHFFHNLSKDKGRNGVVVYSKQKPSRYEFSIGCERFDSEGRFMCLEFDNFILMNIYMPHGGRDKKDISYKLLVYHFLGEYLEEKLKKSKSILLVGDFNVAYNDMDLARFKDNKNNIMYTDNERKAFLRILSLGFADVYRVSYPQNREYTWWPYAYCARERNIGWRIDYMLMSGQNNIIEDIEICSDIYGSDHCPMRIAFNVTEKSGIGQFYCEV